LAGPLGHHLREAPHVPLVRLAGAEPDHPVPLAADQQRQGLLHRLRLAERAAQLVVLTLEGRARRAQQPLDAVARLVQPGEALPRRRELDAVLLVLVHLPAGAEAEHDATAGHVVERRRPVRDDRRVAVRVAEDERPDPEALGAGAERRQQGGRLEVRHLGSTEAAAVTHQVVGDVAAGPAGALRVQPLLEEVLPGLLGVGPEGESHAASVARPAQPHPRVSARSPRVTGGAAGCWTPRTRSTAPWPGPRSPG